jgi:glycine oxidase
MRVTVLGAGIIGLACADELATRGHRVTVVDPTPGHGASYVAAGMLSPAGEFWHGEEALLGLGLRSAALWPAFAAGLGVPIRATGTLLVGLDHGDLQQVQRQAALLAAHGVRVEPLTGCEVRTAEPTLSDRVRGGARFPDDHSVDPREVIRALLARLEPRVTGGMAAGRAVQQAWGEFQFTSHGTDAVVVATGATLPAPYAHLVRGVRGEIVRARTDDPPAQTVRGSAHGEPVYVVPRAGGEVVIGATSEEHDGPPLVTLGGVARLLEAARGLIPGLHRAELFEAMARDRPGTLDNLPLVGPIDDGIVLAAGHYRHGVLLAPLTARLVADHLETGLVEPVVDPRRFSQTTIHERSDA